HHGHLHNDCGRHFRPRNRNNCSLKLERLMAQPVELASRGAQPQVRDERDAGAPRKAINSYSARRVAITFGVALLFALGVLAALNYVVNSAAYQSTDDAFI